MSIAEKAKLLPAELADAAAEQQHAVHVDHRVPGAQRKSEAHQGLGRSGQAGRRRDHAESEELPAARAGRYLAAWGYALKKNNNDENKAQDFVTQLYKNVPVLDSGARGSTTTFAQRGIGDVLLSWENEAYLALNELGKDKVEIVTPSISILAEPPVSVVDKVAAKHGTAEVAKAYLEFLYTEEGQEIAREELLPPAPGESRGEVRGPLSEDCSCSRSTNSSADGRRRRRSISTTAACSTRSTRPANS